MKRSVYLAVIILACLASFGLRIKAQTGTAHGNVSAWKDPSPVGGSGTIQGYYLLRCIGTVATCTATSGTWTSVGGLITKDSATNCTLPSGYSACYLDPAAGLAVNTIYMYAVT